MTRSPALKGGSLQALGRRALAGALPAVLLGGCVATVRDKTPLSEIPADLVVVNGHVRTLDRIRPEADAIAITSGRFRVVGARAEVDSFVGPDTEVIDAAGQFILPGLIDAHLHLFGEGYRRLGIDLVGTRSRAEVLALVAAAAARPGPGGWLRGRGWDQNDWPEQSYPVAADLDLIVPDRAVVLERIDGHAVWANSRAIELAGIDATTEDPVGGRILRRADGTPSGIFIDAAADRVLASVPEYTRAERLEAARLAAAACVAGGLTTIHEPGISGEELAVLKELYRRGEMPLRVYAMLSPGPALERYLGDGPEVGLYGHRLTVRAVKLYADGALGSRGAALLAGYHDEPTNRGLFVTPADELEQLVRRVSLARFQPCVHAIGDAANRAVLDIYERVLGAHTGGVRPRIEHAQVLAPEDLARFASLDVIASMQPTHATSDMPWVGARLGVSRLAGAYAWASLLRSGVHLAFGSDAPVESVLPMWGLYAALTRADHEGAPAGGWRSAEALSRAEALRAFTHGGAYAAFEEELKGSIAAGKLADFVIVDRDPYVVAPAELLELEVLATFVGGQRVYTSDPARPTAAGSAP